MNWPKLSTQEIKLKIFEALGKNLNYRSEYILGVPATFLDSEVFYEDAPFLKEAPFLSMLIANPNHIGCHTLDHEGEPVFKGTQEIERDLIRICSEEIFGAEQGSCDGYVSSGGTEANIEALWIYRNYYMQEYAAKPEEIVAVYSQDSHYSFPKAANLLGLRSLVFTVDEATREVNIQDLEQKLVKELHRGVNYFIVNINLSTTMFGSVDDIDKITNLLHLLGINYKLHIDAAFGGFIYPFTNSKSKHNFNNPHVSSITVDGHKMLQAPYGTGIFLVRKNMLQYVCTNEASYVMGKDYTLCGSRSGANAACMWMILHMYGSVGWTVKMHNLLDKTRSLCSALDALLVDYYHNPYLNMISIKSEFISVDIARKYMLVPDNHEEPAWYKIVMMPHVKPGVLDQFISQLSDELLIKRLLA
ncbi:aspartate aminotransferase family protein [Sphingobacteriaceae bacterium]|nr:aspartate aminotransferase family protein [Sphingobacteriaceae bacterium]